MSSSSHEKGKGKASSPNGNSDSPSLASRIASSASALLRETLQPDAVSLSNGLRHSQSSNGKSSSLSSGPSQEGVERSRLHTGASSLSATSAEASNAELRTIRSQTSEAHVRAIEQEYGDFVSTTTTAPIYERQSGVHVAYPTATPSSASSIATVLEEARHVYVSTPSDGAEVSTILSNPGFFLETEPYTEEAEVDEPSSLFGDASRYGSRGGGIQKPQPPQTNDASEWSGFLERYTDEVWGDGLISAVREARREVQEARVNNRTFGIEGSAVMRLRQLMDHLKPDMR